MSFFVYIATNKSNTLYVGITNNLIKRMAEHKLKLAPSFTSKYNINKLIYFQQFEDVNEAISAEKK